MRIVYVHQYFNPGNGASGLRSTIFARALTGRGHEVHVVSSPAFAPDAGVRRQEIEKGLTVHWIDSPYSQKMGFPQRIKAFVVFAVKAGFVARRQRADLIFATSTPLTVIIPAIFAAAGRKTPIVFEVRDLWPAVPVAIGALSSRPLIFAARTLERLAYRVSRKVVALSEGMRDGIVESGYPASSVSVIPNMADTEMFGGADWEGAEWRLERGFRPDARIVLYCGTLGYVNGVEYMAEIAAEAAHLDPLLQFVVVGDGKEAARVSSRAQSLGVLGRNFHMLGSMPKSSVSKVYAASTVCTSFVRNIPAFEANSANKFFDALAAGRPVAINHGGWQAKQIADAACGLVLPPSDAESAARMLTDLIQDPERLSAMGRSARTLAEEKYSAKRMAGRFVELLEAVVEPRRS